MQNASPLASPIASRSLAPSPFIAADVGGTHARVGWVRAVGPDRGDVELRQVERYAGADWPSLGAILADFRARFPEEGANVASAMRSPVPKRGSFVEPSVT